MEIASPLFVVSYYPREEIWRLTGKRNDGIRRLSCLQKPRNWYVVSDSGTKKLCCKHANKSQQQPSFQKRIGDWVIVQEDEDIRTFAARFHVTPESLRIANGLDSAQVKLKQGEIVFVPYVNVKGKMELSRQLRLSLSRAQRVEPDRKYTIVSEPSQTNLSKGRLNLFPFISVAVLLGSFFYLFSEYRTGTVVLVPSWIKEKAWRAVTALQQYVQVSKEDEENENTEWTLCTLRQRRELAPGITRYTFDLPLARRTLGLELGQRVDFEVALRDSDRVARGSYLLCTERMQQGNFDVVIPSTADAAMSGFDLSGNKDPQFAEGMNALQIGDSVKMKPGAKMLYYRGPKSPVDTLSVVCGGIGVAPICSLLQDILSDAESAVTSVFLLVVNERPEEFIFLDELESLEKRFPRILRLICVWRKPEDETAGEDQEKHHFIERAVASHFPVWKEGTMALLCGSDKLLIPYALKSFRRLGYSEEVVVCL